VACYRVIFIFFTFFCSIYEHVSTLSGLLQAMYRVSCLVSVRTAAVMGSTDGYSWHGRGNNENHTLYHTCELLITESQWMPPFHTDPAGFGAASVPPASVPTTPFSTSLSSSWAVGVKENLISRLISSNSCSLCWIVWDILIANFSSLCFCSSIATFSSQTLAWKEYKIATLVTLQVTFKC
jgi:hypothetical protein